MKSAVEAKASIQGQPVEAAHQIDLRMLRHWRFVEGTQTAAAVVAVVAVD